MLVVSCYTEFPRKKRQKRISPERGPRTIARKKDTPRMSPLGRDPRFSWLFLVFSASRRKLDEEVKKAIRAEKEVTRWVKGGGNKSNRDFLGVGAGSAVCAFTFSQE